MHYGQWCRNIKSWVVCKRCIRLSSSLERDLKVTKLIDFGMRNFFFFFTYALWPIDSSYCKCASFIELKFRINAFLFFLNKISKKNSCTLHCMESNYKKYAKRCFRFKLKFRGRIMHHPSSYYINFGVYRKCNFFTDYTKYHALRPRHSNYLKYIFSIIE